MVRTIPRLIERIAVACCACVIAGCAATQAENEAKIPLESARADRDGIVFGSIGTQVPKQFLNLSVGVRPLGQCCNTTSEDLQNRPHLHRASMSFSRSIVGKLDFSGADEEGVLFAAVLPPGDYEIFRYGFRWGDYANTTQPYFSIPIRVRAGEALYLGRFVVHLAEPRPGSPVRAFVAVRSVLAGDAALLAERVPLSREFKVVDGNLPACSKTGYFQCAR
jgi:hypothetical protein